MSGVCVCVCVCVCMRAHQSSKDEITCNPKIDWAIERKFGVLDELILLFYRDEFDWSLFCTEYFIILLRIDKVVENLWHFFS